MESQHQSEPISVGVLLSQLRQRMTTTARFRLQLPPQEVYNMLLRAIQIEVQVRGKKLLMTKELSVLTWNLAVWLTDDSHYFGFMMSGLCGNGKTTVVKALRRVLNYLNLHDEYGVEWKLSILEAKTICQRSINDAEWFNKLCESKMVAIDDLGCEPVEIQSYGNIYTPLIDLLTRRYDRQLFTVITTNLMPQQIRPRYGDRIADRLNEMVRNISFSNKSFRTPGQEQQD